MLHATRNIVELTGDLLRAGERVPDDWDRSTQFFQDLQTMGAVEERPDSDAHPSPKQVFRSGGPSGAR